MSNERPTVPRTATTEPDSGKSPSPGAGDGGEATGSGDDLSRRDFFQQAAAGATAAGLVSFGPSSAGDDNAPARPAQPGALPVALQINGKKHELKLDPRVSLLDLVREYLHLTGTKKGCDHGQCGACTVLVDGRRVYSCLTLACMAGGSKVTTIEGLADGDTLHPMQAAFIRQDAFQCGYCTPGQICSAVGLLAEGHARSDDDIRELMSGNLCRCGAYPNIVAAIKEVRDAAPANR